MSGKRKHMRASVRPVARKAVIGDFCLLNSFLRLLTCQSELSDDEDESRDNKGTIISHRADAVALTTQPQTRFR